MAGADFSRDRVRLSVIAHQLRREGKYRAESEKKKKNRPILYPYLGRTGAGNAAKRFRLSVCGHITYAARTHVHVYTCTLRRRFRAQRSSASRSSGPRIICRRAKFLLCYLRARYSVCLWTIFFFFFSIVSTVVTCAQSQHPGDCRLKCDFAQSSPDDVQTLDTSKHK